MAPPPLTIDLTDKSTLGALAFIALVREDWAQEIVPRSKDLQVHNRIKFVIDESLRNALHGDNVLVRRFSLPDGSIVIIITDVGGIDHLNPNWCGHQGLQMIADAVGEGNFFFQSNGNVFETYVRIYPPSIEASLAA